MLEEYLLDCGFTKEEITKIIERDSAICLLNGKQIKDRINFLIDLKYSKDDIKHMILSNPNILKINNQKITDFIYTMVNLGYNYDLVIDISSKYPWLITMKENDLVLGYYNLTCLGYSHFEIEKLTKRNPSLYDSGFIKFKEKILYMKDIGYPIKYIKKISIKYDLFDYVDILIFKKIIRDLWALGFSEEDAFNIISIVPRVINININDIINKINFFTSLGYSYNVVLDMIRKNPNILLCSCETINDKIKTFKIYNYTMEEIIYITSNCLFVFNMTIENIAIKLEFLKKVRMSKFILEYPMLLVYDVNIIYARYLYLRSVNKKMNEDNIKLLFVSDGIFCKLCNIDDEKLLTLYSKENNLKKLSRKRMMKK